MSEQFEYRFVTTWPNDASELVSAGADGWEAVGMVPAENGLLILAKRKVEREDEDEDEEEEQEEEEEEEGQPARGFMGWRGRRMGKSAEVVHVHVHLHRHPC